MGNEPPKGKKRAHDDEDKKPESPSVPKKPDAPVASRTRRTKRDPVLVLSVKPLGAVESDDIVLESIRFIYDMDKQLTQEEEEEKEKEPSTKRAKEK